MKTGSIFGWTTAVGLLLGMIGSVTAASGQKSSGNLSGAKLWLTVMDKDHDGTVSKQEFTAYMGAQFDKADADHDAILDKSELEQLAENLGTTKTVSGQTAAAGSSAAKLSLAGIDKDADGTASKQEFRAYMEAQFDRADADHDGTLDRNEMAQLRKNLGIGTK